MSFIEDLMKELNELPTYEIKTETESFKAIRCDTVCDLLTVLFDKYRLEERINDDLHW